MTDDDRDALLAELASLKATIDGLIAKFDVVDPPVDPPVAPFVLAADFTMEFEPGQKTTTKIRAVDGTGPASVVEVGVADPAEAGVATLTPPTTIEFALSEGFADKAVFEYTIALNSDPTVRDTGRINLVPKAVVEPPVDPPPTAGATPIRRVPKGKHFFGINEYPLNGPLAPFAAIKNVIYQAAYLNDSRKGYAKYADGTVVSKRIDHSDAGCRAHARAWIDYMLLRQKLYPSGQVKNAMWMDWESEELSAGHHSHINVPKRVLDAGWSPSAPSSQFITTYDPEVPNDVFLQEAIRWQHETYKYCYEIAKERGITNLDIIGYAMPQRRNPPGTASFAPQAAAMNAQLFATNKIAALAPTLYWTVRNDGPDTLDGFMKWHLNTLTGVRNAFGTSQKFMPTIWGRWQASSTKVVPQGWMTRLMNDFLDWGVDGFMLWRSSADDDGANSANFAKVYEEVVAVIKKRGTFVMPT